MINRPKDASDLSFFLYRSSAAPEIGTEDLTQILTAARRRNALVGLTGCLHYEDGLFFQWLEGSDNELRPVVDAIMHDPRHHSILVLEQGALGTRRFRDWSMKFSDRDRKSLVDWIAHKNVSTVDRQEYAGGVSSFLMSL
ncbi:BLUF domain-containing protein [Paracoccus sp. Z330]|uniref:BLUF domain-containing protein n=1 Tax=Paracoccus onchidii TaxID=3017813 RepID=A0ABT4ZGV4_9RHOB|nr:BLUF domain-containing protein [Paracoccus onchidii]MDB6178565.1 BLUF domain-containing protein [Paracoccus onchidii]